LLAKAEYHLSDDGAWQAVELIADALLRDKEISGRTAKHLFDRAIRQASD
jgi:hypothetical protein